MATLSTECEVYDGLFEYFRPDDWVELHVEPGNTSHDYYKFLVNPAGVRTDMACFADADRSWNGEWRAAAGKTQGAWTVEMFVPTAAFNRKPIGSQWRVNVARRRASTKKRIVWTGNRIPATWPVLGGFNPKAKHFAYKASDILVKPTGNRSEGTCSIRVSNMTGAKVELRPVFRIMRPGSARGHVPHGSGPREDIRMDAVEITDGADRVIEGLIRIGPEETVIAQLALYDNDGNLVFCTKDVGVRVRRYIGGPGPRLNYYTDEALCRLRFDVCSPTGVRKPTLVLLLNGKRVRSVPLKAGGGQVDAEIDLAGVPVGRHSVTAQLVDGGKVRRNPRPAASLRLTAGRNRLCLMGSHSCRSATAR